MSEESGEDRSGTPDDMLEVIVLDDARAFEALEEEWEELYHDSPLATPFQSWAWLYSWWEFYGEGYELRLVTVRSGDLLVGIVPLMLERRRGFVRLLFVGTGPTRYPDVVARQGWEDQVMEAGVDALKRIEGWHVADLQELSPEAAAWSIFRGWDGPKARAWQINYLLIEVKPWEELLMSLSRKLRGTARQAIRRAEADGVSRELAGPEDAEQATRRLVALHRELWRGRNIDPERLTGRFESLIVAAARRMTASGLGSIYELWRDGEVLISGLMVFGSEFDGIYLVGASEEALRRYQWSSLGSWVELDIAHSRNIAHLSLMEGEEPYKLRWNPKKVPHYRIIFGRSLACWAPYAGYRVLRSRVARYAKSESAPRWVKGPLTTYRSLRYRAARYVQSENSSGRIKTVAAKRFKRG